jgi:hypothetical protein
MARRVTRAGTAATRPPSAPLLVNPTLPENWPPHPTTPAEFDAWMAETKTALLKWLREAAAVAQDSEVENTINNYDKEAAQRWRPLEQQTDVETGTIHDPTQREAMEDAMNQEAEKRRNLHDQNKTWTKFIEYRYAQSAYEDFLYYQNVWNRRGYMPGKIYEESTANKKYEESLESLNVQARAQGEEPRSKGKKPAKAPKNPKAKDRLPPKTGTEGQDKTDRRDINNQNSPFLGYYQTWLDHMITLYRSACLGYRKQIPDVVAPLDAHRYTQPPRGTTPRDTPRYHHRARHLEERFPRNKRLQIDRNETEEEYRTKSQRARDITLERAGRMQPITWRIDEEAYATMKDQRETHNGFTQDPFTLSLLPEDHTTHHGSQETSFNYPTSFDASEWGNIASVAAQLRDHAYESLSDPDHDASDPKSKKSFLGYKKDDNGDRIKKLDTGPRYKRETHTQETKDFVHSTTTHPRFGPTVAGRNRNGNWIGTLTQGQTPTSRWVYDENQNRIPLPPRYLPRNKFSTLLVKTSYLRETRRQGHSNAGKTHELSEDEDEGCVVSNANFERSGNVNPQGLGDPWAYNRDSGDEEGGGVGVPGGSDDDESDDESDDEGDVFASSYREGLGDAATRRAGLLLEDLQERFGVLASWTVEHVRELQRGDEEFGGVSDEDILAWYEQEVGL